MPADLQPGKYVLGWRYDAESTQQVRAYAHDEYTVLIYSFEFIQNLHRHMLLRKVWSNCADVALILPKSKEEEDSLATARFAASKAMADVSFNPKPLSKGSILGQKEEAARPKTGPSIDAPYGYPTNNAPCSELEAAAARCSFGLVIEERYPYPNGPSLWPDDPWGSYGMVINAPAAFVDDRWGQNLTRCPAVPLDSPLSPRRADLHQYAMYALNGVSLSKKTCNFSIVVIFASSIALLFGQCDVHCLSSGYDDHRRS